MRSAYSTWSPKCAGRRKNGPGHFPVVLTSVCDTFVKAHVTTLRSARMIQDTRSNKLDGSYCFPQQGRLEAAEERIRSKSFVMWTNPLRIAVNGVSKLTHYMCGWNITTDLSMYANICCLQKQQTVSGHSEKHFTRRSPSISHRGH